MASRSIQEILNSIRTAIFGKDVRESIAEGIEKCYADVAAEGIVHTTDIIDNLNSTNATKVLSAKQGKVLNDDIDFNQEMIDALSKIINGTSKLLDGSFTYTIFSDGTWRYPTSRHIVIPVNSGDAVYIKAKSTAGSSVYAFLKEYSMPVNAQAVVFCDSDQTRHVLNHDEVANATVPADGKYLYISVLSSTGDSQMPTTLTINGIDMLFNIRDEITKLSTESNSTIRSYGTASASGNVDTFPTNSILGVAQSDIYTVSNFPNKFNSGGTILTFQYLTNAGSLAGRKQIFYPNTTVGRVDNPYAIRVYLNGAWSDWQYFGYYVVTVEAGTGKTFSSPATALRYYTSETEFYKWNKYRRLDLVIEPGTYDMNVISTWYAEDSITYRQGLFIPPYATVRGAGKGRTILTYTPTFSDTSDERLASIAPFNMPYESTLKDLSLIVKNCRYCVHSEGTFEGFPDGTKPIPSTYVHNCQITVENVHMEHHGFDSQYTPRYTAPACWGSGSYNNSNQKFVNCEFISDSYSAWLNHNRVGLTAVSRFEFDNCVFINKRAWAYSELAVYASMVFISWAENNITNPVVMKNCYANRFVLSAVRNEGDASPDAKNNYYISADNGIMIVEQITNNSHNTDNYISDNCFVGYTSAAVTTSYIPVSFNQDGEVSAYSTSGLFHGIILHQALAGEKAVVQTKGKISLARCRVSGFSVGDKLGYSEGSWVVDNVNPVLKVISPNVCEVI